MLSITCFESLIKLAICFLLENCGTVRNLRIQQVLPGGTGSVELRQCDSFESLDTKSKICDSRMLFIVLNQWGVLPFITYVSYRGTCFYIALVFLKRSIGRLLECRPCYDARARSEENGQRQERPLFLYVYCIVGAEAEKPGGIWCVFFQDQVFLHKELVLPSFALLRPMCKTQYNS
jgi:hypothetical protein